MGVVFDLSTPGGADAWKKHMDKVIREAAIRGLRAAALRLVNHIVVSVIPAEPRVPVDRGIYRAGWKMRPIEGGAEVYNNTPHASFIEDGVRAANVKVGRLMLDAITAWVKRKGIDKGPGPKLIKGLTAAVKNQRIGATVTKTAKGSMLNPTSDSRARSIAWAIAMNMKKKGIFNDGKGLGILRKASKVRNQYVREEIAREINRVGGKR
jgi:hypothetical protein